MDYNQESKDGGGGWRERDILVGSKIMMIGEMPLLLAFVSSSLLPYHRECSRLRGFGMIYCKQISWMFVKQDLEVRQGMLGSNKQGIV